MYTKGSVFKSSIILIIQKSISVWLTFVHKIWRELSEPFSRLFSSSFFILLFIHPTLFSLSFSLYTCVCVCVALIQVSERPPSFSNTNYTVLTPKVGRFLLFSSGLTGCQSTIYFFFLEFSTFPRFFVFFLSCDFWHIWKGTQDLKIPLYPTFFTVGTQ